MKVAHHSLLRAVGLVPRYLRASLTSAGQPNIGRFGGSVIGMLTSGGARWRDPRGGWQAFWLDFGRVLRGFYFAARRLRGARAARRRAATEG